VNWLVSRAHGTPTVKLWLFDVRSWGPTQATLLGKKLASLEWECETAGMVSVLAESPR